MRFVFQCLVTPHASGRVTVTPIDLPELAVHATSVAAAVEELTLALDDRISRAHPRHLPTYARATAAELTTLEVPVLPVAGAEEDLVRPLRLAALVSPVQRPHTEVRVPSLEVRFWLRDGEPTRAAAELLEEKLAGRTDAELLACRSEGGESLLELALDVTPLRLSDLRRRELTLDERPPPHLRSAPGDEPPSPHLTAGDDDNDDDEGLTAEEQEAEDDWDEDRPRRRARRAPRKPRRPPTPTLRRIGVPWHELAAAGELAEAFERDAIVEELIARVDAEAPNPLVLVGPTGVGKTAILEELARRLAARGQGGPEDPLGPRPFFFVDGSRLIAGDGFFGDWQKQVLDCWKEAQAARAILCLGRAVDLLDAGKSAHSEQNVAQLLAAPLLAREVAVLAEATPDEWAEVERRNQGFARAFAVLRVEEPAPAVTERIVGRLLAAAAKARGLAFEPGRGAEQVTGEIISLSARFQPYGALVGNAAALARRLVDTRAHALAPRLVPGDATTLFSAESGIPEVLLRDELVLDEDQVRAFLAERVHGQPAATARAARVVSLIKANLADRARPAAVLLFSGPTGVGKTELSKALAELCFGSRERLVRLDMGEYAGPDALLRLLGDGVTPGHLTQPVRRQPFSLVLLNEIEKAHPAVFDTLLGLLGEGRLTDGNGKLVDFRAAVVVMTSNLGADTLRERPGFAGGAAAQGAGVDLEAHYRGEARRFFRPELFNRIDEVVVFAPLGAAEIRTIVDRELGRVAEREGLRRRDVTLVVTPEGRAHLARVGLDPRYGARPLKRAIERHLVAPVAAWLAEHPPSGPVRLTAGLDGAREGDGAAGGLVLAAASPPQAAKVGQAGPDGHAGDDDHPGDQVLSRPALLRIVERAAEVRAEVRRWSRSGATLELRQKLAFFNRASQKPGFWHDRSLADDAARAAAAARDLDRAFARAEAQAEAAEDLAYEAWYARQGGAAASLAGELDAVEASLGELRLRLFAALFPPRGRVALELLPGKGSWLELCTLLRACNAALLGHGATVETHVLMEEDATAPDAGAAGAGGAAGGAGAEASSPGRRARPAAARRAAAPKSAPARRQVWRPASHSLEALPSIDGLAALLVASGRPAILLLAAEHGVHRFTSGGATTLVRARFELTPPSGPALAQLELKTLEERAPAEEIRRVMLDRKLVRDLRTGAEASLDEHGDFDLRPLHDAYLSWRLLGEGWTR